MSIGIAGESFNLPQGNGLMGLAKSTQDQG